MKKYLVKIILTVMLIMVVIIPGITASAATNPYGKYQTISGVQTVRCTWYAWEQAYNNTGVTMPNFGNAKNWYTSAQNNGYSVGSTPQAKSIAVWTNSGYGHVGYVVSVNGSKITVNEGGMLDTNGNAYNGTGIINGSVCNSAVGSKKSSYSSSVLVGYIYLTDSISSGGTVTLESLPDKNTITDNNAILWARVDKPSNYAVTKIGIKVRKDGSTYEEGWQKYEAPSKSYTGYTYMMPYYDLKAELGATLTHATKYYLRFYATVNGTEYWSPEYYFTTTGSHSLSSWSTTESATCTTAGIAKRSCTSCGKTETKNLNALGHDYSSAWSIDEGASCTEPGSKSHHCTRCSAKSSVTAIAATGHTYKTATTKATLTKNGKIVKKCACGDIKSTTTVYYPKTIKLSATSYTYNGAVKTPTVTVKDSSGKTVSSSNYTVTYASGRKNAGTYKVTVKMKGNYSGTKTLTFKINPRTTANCTYKLSTTSYTYNGAVKTPTVTVKTTAGTKLTKGTHYTVTYATGRKNVGTYKVTVKMKGNYTGTKTLTFKINPPKTTVSSLTAGKKSLKVYITKKSTQVTGYQIQYSTSKSFKSYKTKNISSYKTTSTTLSGLTAKKTYYVRVRTYKTVGGVKYYSGWSTYKYKKTK